ncbi:hypothetical protein X747_12435 [Mesorhizobium sp. LNJC384A00]|nr:hypothetical protein X747_12435 [Mesorhizobium sp. LNJC384A00]
MSTIEQPAWQDVTDREMVFTERIVDMLKGVLAKLE